MNFLLKDIELFLDDFYIEKAEGLLENSRLGNLVEIDNNLWIGLVIDGKSYEIEIQLQGKRVKAYTCECEFYHQDNICHHIAAGLLLLRQKNPYVPTAKKAAPAIKVNKKLTVAIILAQTPDDELKSFVRQYARHNRKFALDLKTRFIGYVSTLDNELKYNQLLESALNGVFRSYNEISKHGMDHLLKIYEELYVQIEEHIAMKNYREAMDIMASLFKGLPSLLRRKGAHREVLFPMIKDLSKTSEELFRSKMAPDLHVDLWEILFHQAKATIYCHLGYEAPIFTVVTKKCNNLKRFEAYKSMSDELIDFFSNNPSIRANLIRYLYDSYQNSKQKVADFFAIYLSDPAILKLVIHSFLDSNNIKVAKRLAKLGLKSNSKEILPFLEESLLKIAIETDNKKEILVYAKTRFLDTFKFEYYDLLDRHSDNIVDITLALIEQIRDKRMGFMMYQTIASLWIRINDFDAVISLLKERNDLKLIMNFDKFLIKSHQKELMSIYLSWIDLYLKEHFGPAPTKKIQSIIHHLYSIQGDRFARFLVRKIQDTYPDREFLNKSLMVF